MPRYLKVSFWLCALLVLVLSLLPPAPELPSTGWDKSNHLLGFAVLALLGRIAYPGRVAAMLSGVVLYGGLIELLQALTPYRAAEWGDWLADALGVMLAEAMLRAWRLARGNSNEDCP